MQWGQKFALQAIGLPARSAGVTVFAVPCWWNFYGPNGRRGMARSR